MLRLVKIEVDSTPLFLPTSSVNRWTRRVTGEAERAAVRNTPPFRSMARHPTWATGALVRSINSDQITSPVLRRIRVTIGSTSTHALYVHEGTAENGSGYITSHSGRPMPITRFGVPVAYAEKVRGQRANPFLRDGYNQTAARHRALPRMHPPLH